MTCPSKARGFEPWRDNTQEDIEDGMMGRHRATTITVAFCLIMSFPSSNSLSQGWAEARAMKSVAGVGPRDCVINPRVGSKDDKLTVDEQPSSDGAIELHLRGTKVDGRGWINAVTSCLDADQTVLFARDVDLDIQVDTLTGYGSETLRDLVVQISARAGRMRSFSLSAKLGDHGSLRGELRMDAKGEPCIQIEADDASALLRLANLYSRMRGGVISAAIRLAGVGKPGVEVKLEIRDFSVAEPTLGILVEHPTCRRQSCAANHSLKFERLQVAFDREVTKLTIRDATMLAPSFGATMNGTIETRTRVMNLHGTALWARNFGTQPLPSCNMQASSYQLRGPVQAPELRISPLTLLSSPSALRLFGLCERPPSIQHP
jgi:hypothetical protein